jgi:hypothetical protein
MRYLFLAALAPHFAKATFDGFTIIQCHIDNTSILLATPLGSDQICNNLIAGTKYNLPTVNIDAGDGFSFSVCNLNQLDFYATSSSGGAVTYDYYLHDASPPKKAGSCTSDSTDEQIPCTVGGTLLENTVKLNCNSVYNIC